MNIHIHIRTYVCTHLDTPVQLYNCSHTSTTTNSITTATRESCVQVVNTCTALYLGTPSQVPHVQQLKEEIFGTLREEMLTCFNVLYERTSSSCKELYQCNPALPSGYYNITTPQGVERVYCDMNTTNCGNITGGWMRVAYIDMTDENNTCPQGLTYTVASSTHMCTRSLTGQNVCSSLTFPTHGVPYTKVCGRARGYQYYTLQFRPWSHHFG